MRNTTWSIIEPSQEWGAKGDKEILLSLGYNPDQWVIEHSSDCSHGGTHPSCQVVPRE